MPISDLKIITMHSLVIISTYQEPHLTDFYTLNKFIEGGSFEYFDARRSISFKVDAPIYNDSFLVRISKTIRNSFFGYTKSLLYKKKNSFFPFKIDINLFSNFQISSDEFLFIWRAYRSFLINKTRRSFFAFSYQNFNKIKQDYFYAKHLAKEIILSNRFDSIFIFNGRFPFEYFLVNEIKRNSKINIKFLETNQYTNRIVILNHSPHDLSSFDYEIIKYSNENDEDKLISLSLSLIDNWRNKFILKSTPSLNKTVVFFTGSIDEYEFFYDNFFNQADFALSLEKILRTLGVSLLIRVHPNTREKSIDTMNFWRFFKLKNPHIVVCFTDELSSYQLIDQCLFSISTGSSIAPQCFLINRKHVVLGNYSYYANLSCFKIFDPCDFLNTLSKFNISDLLDFVKSIPTLLTAPYFAKMVASSLLFERCLGFDRTHLTFNKNPILIKTTFDKPKSRSDNDILRDSKKWLFFCNLVGSQTNFQPLDLSNFINNRLSISSDSFFQDYSTSNSNISLYQGDLVAELSKINSFDFNYLVQIFIELSNISPINKLCFLDRLSLAFGVLNDKKYK